MFDEPSTPLALSLVIPVFNEEANLAALYAEITAACDPLHLAYEMVFVDDGSTDGSAAVVHQLRTADERVVLVRLRRNYGQTAGFAAGFARAQGAIIITLDADRQNDPADIPQLLQKMNQGEWDVVNGWRQHRQDGFLLRRLPSQLANRLIAWATGVRLRDRGCSMRAFRRQVVQELHLYGEMHRFIPELVHQAGFRMAEVAVNHRPRVAGSSKYGLSRTFRVLLDLLTVLFLSRYGDRPMYLFGSLGLVSGALGLFLAVLLSGQKLWAGVQGGWPAFHDYTLNERPLLLLAVLLIIVGVQFLATGLTAELITRTYYESQNKPVYRIKDEGRITNYEKKYPS